MGRNVLAIDLGTSSVRAMIVDGQGNILCKKQSRYDVIRVGDYRQEQSPDEIYGHFVETAKACVRQAGAAAAGIEAVALSSQMYNIFPVDERGDPLYNMILWSDSRSERQAERMTALHGRDCLYRETGCPLSSMYPFSKILWMKEEEREIAERAVKYISIKEYIVEKMTGKYIVDYSMAAGTGIFNIYTMRWDGKALAYLGLTEEAFSEPVSGLACLEFVNDDLREELGLPKEVKVVSAGGDGPMAQVGSGACEEGSVNVDIGTSAAARVIVHRPIVDSEGRMWTYAVTKDSWVYGGILSNAGNGYHWLVQNIAGFMQAETMDSVFDTVEERMEKLSGIREELLFVPYLLRCRSPYWDDRVRATIYGLTQEHTFIDIAKAYLESIGFDMFSLIRIIGEQVEVKDRILLTGGLARSAMICQLLADILGREIVTLRSGEGSIMGAAIFGLKALGVLEELHFGREPEVLDSYAPRAEIHRKYQKKYEKYVKLRNALHELET